MRVKINVEVRKVYQFHLGFVHMFIFVTLMYKIRVLKQIYHNHEQF